MNKTCSKCGEEKPLEAFSPRKGAKHGCRADCRICSNAAKRSLYHRNSSYKEARNASTKKYKSSHREEIAKRSRKYRKENKDTVKATNRRWVKNNRGKHNAKAAKYRAAKKNATPKWLTDAHWRKMLTTYETCPPGWHVDHIEPLQGEHVCGLHVPWNLRHLPAFENRSKGNKPTQPP